MVSPHDVNSQSHGPEQVQREVSGSDKGFFADDLLAFVETAVVADPVRKGLFPAVGALNQLWQLHHAVVGLSHLLAALGYFSLWYWHGVLLSPY
jgi:hypothetical protein